MRTGALFWRTKHRQEPVIAFFSRILIAAYLIEAGFLLVLSPWTALWDRNYFASLWPWLDAVMRNNFARGAVTGVGVITAWVGVRELSSAFVSRWSSPK